MKSFKEMLSEAPDSQLDASMVELVKGWSEPPTAVEVLEVLDRSIFSSLASGLVITGLQIELDNAIGREATTYEAVAALATWRARL